MNTDYKPVMPKQRFNCYINSIRPLSLRDLKNMCKQDLVQIILIREMKMYDLERDNNETHKKYQIEGFSKRQLEDKTKEVKRLEKLYNNLLDENQLVRDKYNKAKNGPEENLPDDENSYFERKYIHMKQELRKVREENHKLKSNLDKIRSLLQKEVGNYED